jgi:GDPmannose 4,6-dehydratase
LSIQVNYNLVFGANGQDGFLTCKYLLLKRKEPVIAVIRRKSEFLSFLKNMQKLNKNFFIEEVNELSVDQCNKILLKYNILKIFFFAGYSKIPTNDLEKKICYDSNFIIFDNLLKSIVNVGIKSKVKILHLSSGEIYGQKHQDAKNENSITVQDNYYSETKVKIMNVIETYKKKESLFISNAICFNHDSYFTPRNHIIRVVIERFKNEKVVKFFDVENYRNFSHVYDFIPLFYKILDLKNPDDFILANNDNHQISNLIDLVKIKLNFQNKIIEYKSSTLCDQISRLADNSKIRSLFNYNPTFNLEKLVDRMISYEKKNFYLN